MTLLNEIHDIIEQGDNGTSHDIVDVMFNLLDANQLTQLEDIIVNQYPYTDKDDLFIDINNIPKETLSHFHRRKFFLNICELLVR